MNGLQSEIASVSEKLYYLRVFPKVPAWVNYQLKKRANPRAILYSLEQCLSVKPKDPWPWCEVVIRKSEPKFNARDFEAKAEKDKNGFIELVEALKKFMGKGGDANGGQSTTHGPAGRYDSFGSPGSTLGE